MKNLLVIGVVSDLNLKKFDVCWFERFLEIDICDLNVMGEMRVTAAGSEQ